MGRLEGPQGNGPLVFMVLSLFDHDYCATGKLLSYSDYLLYVHVWTHVSHVWVCF